MSEKKFVRKSKENFPVVAICYDFDKTLTPDDMQAQGFIQSVGMNVEDFWSYSNSLADNNNMDQNLAYMLSMKDKSYGQILFNRKTLAEYGSKITLFPGVEEWFERIRKYGRERDVIVEHYIISSGLLEMIEGTSVAQKGAFERVYASSFYYDEKDMAIWPAQVVNYTNKTQFLFRIEKGVLDVNDPGVNDSFAPEDIRVPFSNIIYIGDSDTDIPCMKLVNSYGGSSIGVYSTDSSDKTKVFKMIRENRIKYFAPADYSENGQLDIIVKNIIDRTAVNFKLEGIYFECKKETKNYDRINTEDGIVKNDLLISLSSSRSYATTHTVIAKMASIASWDKDEIDELCAIALRNGQVRSILRDEDIKLFYSSCFKRTKSLTQNMKSVKEMIES